jgi:hypothetical protein
MKLIGDLLLGVAKVENRRDRETGMPSAAPSSTPTPSSEQKLKEIVQILKSLDFLVISLLFFSRPRIPPRLRTYI